MANIFNKSVFEITLKLNPLIKFEDTYDIHKILEEKGYWESEEVLTKNFSFFANGRHGKTGTRTVKKPFRFRVDHGNGYITQNTYSVGQVVPDIEDIALAVA